MLINGDSGTTISAFDRGLQYGDGLFETIAVADAHPCLWQRHYQRLQAGGKRLGISIPTAATMIKEIQQEIGFNDRGVIKVIVTRGKASRGYQPDPEIPVTRAVHFSPWPSFPASTNSDGVSVRLCNTRLGSNRALAGIKHLNRLEQVLARSEWDDPGISEGLMLDANNRVIEGTMSNIFMFKDGNMHTPDLTECGVEGVMRNLVLEVAAELGRPVNIGQIELPELLAADTVFLTNSLIGIWPVRDIDGKPFNLDHIDRDLMLEVNDRAYV
ncbi:MAG: aminodeoxychorismate lyase [Gammaproteobacteria bacterium]|nr:aminodeoxychorismate lyase [Gammaproteobacteria bacterium]